MRTRQDGVTGYEYVAFHIGAWMEWVTLSARVYAGVPRVDLHTEVLNNEEYVRYRVLFPTSIKDGTVTHEIPFGAVERPQQELPAQNWVDLSDDTHGLALLNRGLPGNNADDGVLMLSLMRASQLVAYGASGGYDPSVSSASGQELGKRLSFDYALVPHQGGWREAQVYRRGLELNNPLLVHKTAPGAGDLPAKWGLLAVEPGNVVISALKMGRDGATILRLYEAEGRGAKGARITFSARVERAQETDLLERPVGEAVLRDGALYCDLGPFEIKTFALYLAPRR